MTSPSKMIYFKHFDTTILIRLHIRYMCFDHHYNTLMILNDSSLFVIFTIVAAVILRFCVCSMTLEEPLTTLLSILGFTFNQTDWMTYHRTLIISVMIGQAFVWINGSYSSSKLSTSSGSMQCNFQQCRWRSIISRFFGVSFISQSSSLEIGLLKTYFTVAPALGTLTFTPLLHPWFNKF